VTVSDTAAVTTAVSSSSQVDVSSAVASATAANKMRANHGRGGDADVATPLTHDELVKMMRTLEQIKARLEELVRKHVAQK